MQCGRENKGWWGLHSQQDMETINILLALAEWLGSLALFRSIWPPPHCKGTDWEDECWCLCGKTCMSFCKFIWHSLTQVIALFRLLDIIYHVGPYECSPPCCCWRPLADCQVPHAQIWRQQVWPGQPWSKLSPQGSERGPPQSGAVPHWGRRVRPQSQRQGKIYFLHMHTLCLMSTCHLIQNDLDCFLLACYHGKLKVLQELVKRHNMDPHVVNAVCVCIHRGI